MQGKILHGSLPVCVACMLYTCTVTLDCKSLSIVKEKMLAFTNKLDTQSTKLLQMKLLLCPGKYSSKTLKKTGSEIKISSLQRVGIKISLFVFTLSVNFLKIL